MIFNAILRKELPKKPANLPATGQRLWKICQACWNFKPGNRLTAEQAIAAFNSMNHASPQEVAGKHWLPERGLRAFYASAARRINSFGG